MAALGRRGRGGEACPARGAIAVEEGTDAGVGEAVDFPGSSYVLHGGVRAVERLRLTLAEVNVACVRSQVTLSLFTDFELTDPALPGTLRPGPHHGPVLARLVEELARAARPAGRPPATAARS
jgi:hypothetical protein